MKHTVIMDMIAKVVEREQLHPSEYQMNMLRLHAKEIVKTYQKPTMEEVCPVKEFHVEGDKRFPFPAGKVDGYAINDDNSLFLIHHVKPTYDEFDIRCVGRKEWLFYENIGPNTREGDTQNFYMILEISHYTDNHIILNMTKSQVNRIRQATVFLYNPMYESIMAKVRDVIHFTNHNFKSLSGKGLNLEQDMQYFYAWYKFIECNDDQANAIKDICEYLDKISSRNTIMGYLVYEKY